MCQTRVLATKDQTVISSCIGCGMYYVWHNNLVLNFSTPAFDSFREVVDTINFEHNCLPFPDGNERLILHTPNDDISFAFDEAEFEAFRAAIDEAIYMNEIYSLMRNER